MSRRSCRGLPNSPKAFGLANSPHRARMITSSLPVSARTGRRSCPPRTANSDMYRPIAPRIQLAVRGGVTTSSALTPIASQRRDETRRAAAADRVPLPAGARRAGDRGCIRTAQRCARRRKRQRQHGKDWKKVDGDAGIVGRERLRCSAAGEGRPNMTLPFVKRPVAHGDRAGPSTPIAPPYPGM